MDNPRWLRIIIIGLILAALAITYYLLTGAFSLKGKSSNLTNNTQQTIPAPSVVPTPSVIPTSAPKTAFDRITERNQKQVQNLPNTGFPEMLAGMLLISVMTVGLGLRKFPN